MSKSPEPHRTGAELSAADRRLLALGWNETASALSAGLTHDLCNTMTGIVSLSELLLNANDANEKTRKGLALIRDNALKAGQLAQRFYRLHHDAPGQKSFLDLNQEISSLTALLQKLLTRRVPVQTALDPGQLPIEADPVELRQVIMNVAVDFSRSLAKGGHLLFRTVRLHSPPADAQFKSSKLCAQAGQSWVQFTLEQSTETADGKCEAESPHDPDALREAFLCGDTMRPVGLGIWRALLFAERHAAALSSIGSDTSHNALHLWHPCADLSAPIA
jgi:hypothetical protein